MTLRSWKDTGIIEGTLGSWKDTEDIEGTLRGHWGHWGPGRWVTRRAPPSFSTIMGLWGGGGKAVTAPSPPLSPTPFLGVTPPPFPPPILTFDPLTFDPLTFDLRAPNSSASTSSTNTARKSPRCARRFCSSTTSCRTPSGRRCPRGRGDPHRDRHRVRPPKTP